MTGTPGRARAAGADLRRAPCVRARTVVLVVAIVVGVGAGAGSGSALPVADDAAAGMPPASVGAPDPSPPLRWPVLGGLVAGWDAPPDPYAAGHRGVDLAAPAGTPVRAMGPGVVGFAGVVAGRAWISVDHAGDLRTTVGPMATIAVTAGRAVDTGSVLGTSAGTAHATLARPRTGRLHVSARVAGRYVDPAGLVGNLVATLRVPDRAR